jgi:hypothetical protein
MEKVKIVIYVPVSHADAIREALGRAGTGKIGNYDFCSFSSRGTGRFLPNEHAKPAIGSVGVFEAVEEERIEVTCDLAFVSAVIAAVRVVHPYDEMAYDVYPLLTL